MKNSRVGAFIAAIVLLQTPPQAVYAQITEPPAPIPAATSDRSSTVRDRIRRWVELQNASLNLRYRFVDNTSGVTTTSQVQHRETLRARVKFDASGRYALNLGLFTGTRFTSGWNNTAWGRNDAQKNLAFRAVYLAASPITGIEAQYGSLYIVKGQSTELTTYDEDGYVAGGRMSVKRPRQLYLDDVSITVGYLAADPAEIPFSKRTKYLNDTPNYRHILVDKKLGKGAAVSADFTDAAGARTWRQALSVKTPELRVIDTVIFENYQRTNRMADQGFALTLDKALTRKVSVNGGYASIDPLYGILNADRFQIGNRVFAMATCTLSPEFLASVFVTRAVGNDRPLPQRTLSNIVFTYNALPALRRTGLF